MKANYAELENKHFFILNLNNITRQHKKTKIYETKLKKILKRTNYSANTNRENPPNNFAAKSLFK